MIDPMMSQTTSESIDRYLRVLAIHARPPSLPALTEIVAAHLWRIPFENVSKIYRWRHEACRLPTLAQFLDGAERHHLGGTCYSNNLYLCELLRGLGYEVSLCGADMSQPDVHLALLVRLGGREYLVDAGNAAPFVSPIPRDTEEDQQVESGGDRYVLKPRDAEGRSRMEHWRDGKRLHGYLLKPEPRTPDHFAAAIADSFRPEAVFLNALLLTRFAPGRAVVIHNLSVALLVDGAWRRRIASSRAELASEIELHFGIPSDLSSEVLACMPQLREVW
jgi:N-hydroxyarylamine O-acetyltransferase